MIDINSIKTWSRVAIIALLPLLVMFPATAFVNIFTSGNKYYFSLELPGSQWLYTFYLGLKGILYGLPICYVMWAKLFATNPQNIISFIVPAAYLLIIILAYFFILPLYRFIPRMYRSIGSFSTPVMLAIPYIWRSIDLLRRKKTIEND